MASKRPSIRSAADEPPAYQTTLPTTSLSKPIPEEDSEERNSPIESRSRRQKARPSSSRHEYDRDDSDEPPAGDCRGGKQNATATRSHQDDGRGRGLYDQDDSDEPPAGDRRGGKQKASARPSRCDDRRRRYDSRDDDRYGGSRRDHGNKARDQSESRSRSRSRDRASSTALVKYGGSSRALSKRDGRSKTGTKDKGSSRAKHDHSDDEEEEVIKIARYIAIDIDELYSDDVERLCELLDVRASKVKQWCERELVRKDKTTGLIDFKRLIVAVDEEDAKKLRRLTKKLEEEAQAERRYGGHSQHRGHDCSRA